MPRYLRGWDALSNKGYAYKKPIPDSWRIIHCSCQRPAQYQLKKGPINVWEAVLKKKEESKPIHLAGAQGKWEIQNKHSFFLNWNKPTLPSYACACTLFSFCTRSFNIITY